MYNVHTRAKSAVYDVSSLNNSCSNLGPFGGLPDGETVTSLAVLYAGWFGAQTVQVSGGDVRAIL